MVACGGKEKSAEEHSFSKEADKIESESNLSSACEKDLKKYAEFLDDAKEMMKRHSEGQEMSSSDKAEWQDKAQELMKEFATSMGTMSNPDCVMAFSKIQTEFSQTMMKMAQAQ